MNFEDDYIRPPDVVKKEQLIIDEYDEDLIFNKTIEESIELFQKKEMEEIEKRKNLFINIISKFKRIIPFDEEMNNIYKIIEPIINNYIQGNIYNYKLDPEMHTKIFYYINKLRLTPSDIKLLYSIININV